MVLPDLNGTGPQAETVSKPQIKYLSNADGGATDAGWNGWAAVAVWVERRRAPTAVR
jgi:hypothetical protein